MVTIRSQANSAIGFYLFRNSKDRTLNLMGQYEIQIAAARNQFFFGLQSQVIKVDSTEEILVVPCALDPSEVGF